MRREDAPIVRPEQHAVVRPIDRAEAIDSGAGREVDPRDGLGSGVESGERKGAARSRYIGEKVDPARAPVDKIANRGALTERRNVVSARSCPRHRNVKQTRPIVSPQTALGAPRHNWLAPPGWHGGVGGGQRVHLEPLPFRIGQEQSVATDEPDARIAGDQLRLTDGLRVCIDRRPALGHGVDRDDASICREPQAGSVRGELQELPRDSCRRFEAELPSGGRRWLLTSAGASRTRDDNDQ